MPITKEYLEDQLANMNRQAQEASVTLQHATGAIALLRHMLAALETDPGIVDGENPPAPSEPQQ